MTNNNTIGSRFLNLLFLLIGFLAVIAPAQAQIAFRAAGAQIAGTGASITPVIPAGTQAGDFAVLVVAGRPSDTSEPAAPAGWTLRSSALREVGARDLKIMTFYRTLAGGDTNPTVTLPANWQGSQSGMSGQIAVWSGVSSTTPFDVADVTANAASAATWVAPAISTVTAGAWVVSAVATPDANALGLSVAQSFAVRMTGANYDTTTGGDHAVGVADKTQAVAGAVTMPTWNQTVNASDQWAGISFALRPNLPPTVTLTSPTNNAVFTAPGSVTLTANAADSDGTITKVEFFDGANLITTVTVSPYTFNWTNVATGTYSLTAKATDNRNAVTTSAPITINVSNAPTVTLTSPTNNATYSAPASIPLSANATDDGTIAQVEFYNGATLIGTVTTSPYNATWAAVPAGNYTLTAKAIDNLGIPTTSAPIAISVQANVPAGMYFIHPDHLNTPRLITKTDGTPVWRWDNDDPFGNNVPNENPSAQGNFTCNLRLPGQYFDRETNLHYNYFRDYDPAIGRYIQFDPIGLSGGINGFAYTDSNPISRRDPLGLWSISIEGYAPWGGGIVFGRDPNSGGGFFTIRVGFGGGGGAKWDPVGGRPGSRSNECTTGGWGIGGFGDIQFNVPLIQGSLQSNTGINFFNKSGLAPNPYGQLLNPSGSLGDSVGIKAEAAVGAELTFFSPKNPGSNSKCGCP